MEAKCSSLTEELGSVIDTLHNLFDEIGLSRFEREQRETSVYAALNAALQEQVRLNTNEKNELVEQCQNFINSIRQLQRSLNDDEEEGEDSEEHDGLRITIPLLRCREALKEKHKEITKIHAEQFEQVKKLVRALNTYAQALESNFLQIPLPPLNADASQIASFNISHRYLTALDQEFTRVYGEYTRRVSTVQSISTDIVQLWAELGTPSIQTDQAIVKCYRDTPEQLGLREEDIRRLKGKKERLLEEKQAREKKMNQLKEGIIAMWEKLNIDENERKQFLSNHRGFGLRCLQELEDESNRLLELKRQNLHIFVEDARIILEGLWEKLYFSEEEMLEFSPAFSDVYTDALLSAHEIEIARLEKLVEERAPVISLIEKHRSLINDKEQLALSATDSSRLLGKGAGRDPTRLLREEKMRKRIQRELPKVELELKKLLEKWEKETGQPFTVHGEAYLETLAATMPPPPARTTSRAAPAQKNGSSSVSRTPSTKSLNGKPTQSAPPVSHQRTRSVPAAPKSAGPDSSRRPKTPAGSRPKTPTATTRPKTPSAYSHAPQAKTPTHNNHGSRLPLSTMKDNTVERKVISKSGGANPRKQPIASSSHMPPPKMAPLNKKPTTPAAIRATPTPAGRNGGLSRLVKQISTSRSDDEDTPRANYYQRDYQEDYSPQESVHSSYSNSSYQQQQSRGRQPAYTSSSSRPSPTESGLSVRIASACSSASLTSGYTNATSENWETFDEKSGDEYEEEEPDARAAYYGKLRQAHGKRYHDLQQGYNHTAVSSENVQILRSDDEWDDDDDF